MSTAPVQFENSMLQPLKDLHLEYPALKAARQDINDLYVHGHVDNKGRCALLYGPTGVGKTRFLDSLVLDLNQSAFKTVRKLPIVWKIEVPTKCTSKVLNEQILRAIGAPHDSRERVPESTIRVANAIVQNEVKLIILDEAQHLIRHNTKAVLYEVADHCKQLLDKSGCPILFAGLDTIQSFLLENPQLKRRSAPTIRLRPIDWREKDDRNLFRLLLREFDKVLPFSDRAGLDNVEVAARLHYACGGTLGELSRLLLDASIVALNRGARTLASDHLASAYDGYRLDGEGKTINPFTVPKLPAEWAPRDSRYGVLEQ